MPGYYGRSDQLIPAVHVLHKLIIMLRCILFRSEVKAKHMYVGSRPRARLGRPRK